MQVVFIDSRRSPRYNCSSNEKYMKIHRENCPTNDLWFRLFEATHTLSARSSSLEYSINKFFSNHLGERENLKHTQHSTEQRGRAWLQWATCATYPCELSKIYWILMIFCFSPFSHIIFVFSTAHPCCHVVITAFNLNDFVFAYTSSGVQNGFFLIS